MRPFRTSASVLATAVALLCGAAPAGAASYTESTDGDLSGDRNAPTTLVLDYAPSGNVQGSNIVSGTTGRNAVTGVVDVDYLRITVPDGFALSALRVGNQTTVGGGGSFLGLAAGPVMPVAPNAANATGLLGYRVYGTRDIGTDILDDMAAGGNGASGFTQPLGAGVYTVWVQELATGTFDYRFNFVLSPVPEPGGAPLLAAGLLIITVAARRRS